MVLRKTLCYFSQASALLSTLALVLSLVACGGGGGGGGTPNLLGNVADSTRQPLAGVSIAAYDNNGKQVGSTKSDAAGRYKLRVPTGKPLTLVATGLTGTFPAQTENITLVSGSSTLLDIYLPSTDVATESSANVWQSQAVLRSMQAAVLDATLSAPQPTAVYLAPYDVAEIGNGYPIYSVSPFALADSSITEYFAAAGVTTDVAFDQAVLYLPVPLNLVTTPPANADLYRFDPTTHAYVVAGTATLGTDLVNGDPAYFATITADGLYRVGTSTANNADSTVGTVLYQDLTPAAGITVFVTGTDYGYQQIAVTDVNGQFSALTKNGGSSSYEFVAWGYGLQLSATDTSPSTTLPFNEPMSGTPAATSITLDDVLGPISIGLIAASGRMSTDDQIIDGTLTALARADVSFNVSAFGPDPLTFQATTKGSGIQEIIGTSFDNLKSVPTSGYVAYDGFTFPSLVINPAGGGQVFVIQTDVGYAKVGIDTVSGAGPYTLEVRAAFSLTGKF